MSEAKLGHKVSTETREKIRNSLTGRRLKDPDDYSKIIDTCSICGNKFEKQCYYRGKRAYCTKCRGKDEFTCKVCNKKFSVYRSSVRCNGAPPVCCSNKCRSVYIRKPWEEVSRSGLKLKWIREFGIDSLVCNRCGHNKSYNIELHHKIYKQDGGKNDPSNLEPLCLNCHGIEHYEHGADRGERKLVHK